MAKKTQQSKAVQLNAWQSIVAFLKGVRSELQKAVWPTKEQTIKLTTLVIVISLIVGGILGVFDNAFFALLNAARSKFSGVI